MTQEEALKILKMGYNVFLTGEPGAGKTHTVNAYVQYLRVHGIEPAITASTGIAATHIGGMTIHSWAGIGIKDSLNDREIKKIASTTYITKRMKRTKVLIIDEVSMLSGGTLALVDRVCRAVLENNAPFGGMQVIMVGDFFQLPPIIKNASKKEDTQISFMQEPEARFAYEALAWKQANLVTCYLTEQHRQDDQEFLAVLSAIRRNTFSGVHRDKIAMRKIDYEAAPAHAPKLFSYNLDVDRVNREILEKIPEPENNYTMSSEGPEPLVLALKRGCLSPESLSLKIGASVMFTKNNPKEGFVNGTLGIVESFDKHTREPIVKTRDGRTLKVEAMDWVIEEDGKPRAKVSQLPLRLAWAITVHKSQGMSLDEAVMDLGGVFEYGQGYVALSRVRNLKGLYLLDAHEHAFKVDPEIVKKDLEFQKDSEKISAELAGMTPDFIAEKIKQCIVRFDGRSKLVSGSIDFSKPIKLSLEKMKKVSEKTYAPWNKQQDEELEKLFKNNFSVGDLASAFNRSKGSILARLKKLNILEG